MITVVIMQHASVEDYTICLFAIALSESNLWLSMQSTERFISTAGKFKCLVHYSVILL